MPEDDSGGWVTCRVGQTGFRADATVRSHRLSVDEPVAQGGADSGPTPYEYLLIALGGCTAMTLRLYANRKRWPLEEATVSLRQARSYEEDCEQCVDRTVGITRIQRRIDLTGALSDEQRARLLEIADRCPVKQTLNGQIRVETIAT